MSKNYIPQYIWNRFRRQLAGSIEIEIEIEIVYNMYSMGRFTTSTVCAGCCL
jgi:hypothetical protein